MNLKRWTIVCLLLLLGACSSIDVKKEEQSEVYLGSEDAKNEILLVFDYSCSWCTTWIEDVFPEVKELTEDGSVKFESQSVGWLNENSLRFAELDYLLKEKHPEKYFDVLLEIITDASSQEDWGSEKYISSTLKEYDIDPQLANLDLEHDVINITDKIIKEMNIESVPTLFVNGTKISNPFHIEEIISSLN